MTITEAVDKFCQETLQKEETKENPEMVKAIAELIKATFPF